MDTTSQLLNYICQNAEMGKETIKHLLTIMTDHSVTAPLLESQMKEYNEIYDLAQKRLSESHIQAEDVGTREKITSYLMINFNTMLDKTPSHIAEMMIQGSTMGIIDITKKIKEFQDADKNSLKLADRLLKFEQSNVEEVKKFL